VNFALFFTAHSVSATAWALLLSWLFGGLTPLIAVISVWISLFRARRFVRSMRNTLEWRAQEASRPWTAAELAIATFTLFAAWKHFMWLMPLMPATGGATVTTLSATNYGDLPLHLNFIRAFANGIDFLPVNPIFASEPLRYPFGPDLYNALWEILAPYTGLQTSGHLLITGLCLTLTSLVLLRELGGAWAMAGFFLAGGAVAMGAGELDWKSFFLSIWITQRGMMWALPMGLILLLYLRPHLSGQGLRLSKRATVGVGRMWALLPFFHAHSFVAVSLLLFLLTWRDFGVSQTRAFLRRFFFQNRALVWAFVPATCFVLYASAGFAKASVAHVRAFWMMPRDAGWSEGFIWFWRNFGVSFVVLVATLSFIVSSRKLLIKRGEAAPEQMGRSAWDEGLILAGVFLFFSFVMLAPWEWDNVKVLLWPWVLLFALAGRGLLQLASLKTSWIWSFVTWVGIATAFSSGIITISKSWEKPQTKSVKLWTLEQIADGQAVLARAPSAAVFAAAPTPVHILAYFGRLRAVGYNGHLWSHAIDYRASEEALTVLMTGAEGWQEAAKQLRITHIYWGPEERQKWGEGQPSWQTVLSMVASAGSAGDRHEVYEFKEKR
jgi:hypothetical protein